MQPVLDLTRQSALRRAAGTSAAFRRDHADEMSRIYVETDPGSAERAARLAALDATEKIKTLQVKDNAGRTHWDRKVFQSAMR